MSRTAEHAIEIVTRPSEFHEPGLRQARCSCGWRGCCYAAPINAERSGQRHVEREAEKTTAGAAR